MKEYILFERVNGGKAVKYRINKNGCWVCTSHSCGTSTYPNFKREKKYMLIHRYVYLKLKGEIPKGLFVCHRCDNTKCLNPNHLFLGTHNDNMKDRNKKGRQNRPVGDKNPSAKLTTKQVVSIKKDLAKGISYKQLALQHNVTATCIQYIKKGKSWEHIKIY